MKSQETLESVHPPFVAWKEAWHKSWRRPLHLPRFLINAFLESLPGSIDEPLEAKRQQWIRHLYLGHGQLGPLVQDIRQATQRHVRLVAQGEVAAPRGKALVSLVRGFGYAHAFHHYLIACALRREGYEVLFLTCEGRTESCGSGATGKPLTAPPFLCAECRKLSRVFSEIASPQAIWPEGWEEEESLRNFLEGFSSCSLDDFAEPELEQAALCSLGASPSLSDVEVEGLPLGRLLQPYLLRFCQGHRSRINWENAEIRRHFQGALRLSLRYRRVLVAEQPDVVVLFNGLFSPEYVWGYCNEEAQLPTLFSERGPRRDTLFLSREPACHYRSHALWEAKKDEKGEEAMVWAKANLESRQQGHLDPSGRVRQTAIEDREKYHRLAHSAFVIYFPPIFDDTASMEKPSVFADAFDVLVHLCETAIRLRKRLVIRCHPDEANPGREGAFHVSDFLKEKGYGESRYIHELLPQEQWNAYLLAELSSATVIYNGTLGMELPALGYPIWNLAQSHYAQKGFTRDLQTLQELEELFLHPLPKLTQEEQEVALKYWRFYFQEACLDIGEVLHEAGPSSFEFPLNPSPAKEQELAEKLRGRLRFLLQEKG